MSSKIRMPIDSLLVPRGLSVHLLPFPLLQAQLVQNLAHSVVCHALSLESCPQLLNCRGNLKAWTKILLASLQGQRGLQELRLASLSVHASAPYESAVRRD